MNMPNSSSRDNFQIVSSKDDKD